MGICFDLCHSAVTDEAYEKVLSQAERQNVTIAKVQISSALQRDSRLCSSSTGDLEELTDSAYFHQCRVDDILYTDIDQVPTATRAEGKNWRIHCHVPICYSDYGSGWLATAWRPAVAAAIAAQIKDFEVETYTLSLLNTKFVKGESVEACVAEEICAGFLALGLDTDAG